jgi:catechol 2,3-dioxygenase-like lactoylglutathione lyase family enzyme
VMRNGLRAVATLLLLVGAARAEPVTEVGEIGLTVSDVERARAFYRDVLGFEPVGEAEVTGDAFEHLEGVFAAHARVVHLRLGGERIALTEYLAPVGRAIPESRSNDRWFQHLAIVVRDMDAAYARLRAAHVAHVSPLPQTLPAWNRAAGGIKAFYFRDPDGHTLELIWFPAGKGDPKWQRPTRALFLGIDHTAIGVGSTDEALALYRDHLGLRVAGESENYGIEQERLNAVFGAHLRITGLRAPAGPGIELLEYLAPRDGRPTPADVHANDLVHWQTALRVHGLDGVARELRGVRAVSAGVVDVGADKLGFRRGALVRDGDGHGLLLCE